MSIGKLVATAFHQARQKHSELNKRWIESSFRIGSALPNSLLMVSIQREGELDLVIRCIEDETADRLAKNENDDLFIGNYLHVLSGYWIGGMYEIFRLLRSRGFTHDGEAFSQLLHDFEILRIPLEKHEIAKDRVLESPLHLVRQPPKGDAADEYVYSIDDPSRSHIMPSGVTQRGSITWCAIDLKIQAGRWIERRWLSDRALELWKKSQ